MQYMKNTGIYKPIEGLQHCSSWGRMLHREMRKKNLKITGLQLTVNFGKRSCIGKWWKRKYTKCIQNDKSEREEEEEEENR